MAVAGNASALRTLADANLACGNKIRRGQGRNGRVLQRASYTSSLEL